MTTAASGVLPLSTWAKEMGELLPSDTLMPALFIGHGNPMNAILDNDFTRAMKKLPASIPVPKAIVCVSAHWLTKGTFVNGSAHPKMIYDMYGFPDELYKVDYPAPG